MEKFGEKVCQPDLLLLVPRGEGDGVHLSQITKFDVALDACFCVLDLSKKPAAFWKGASHPDAVEDAVENVVDFLFQQHAMLMAHLLRSALEIEDACAVHQFITAL